MYPLLGIYLFSRHYIISTPPFQSICTSSWVTVYSPDITSPLPPPPPPSFQSICSPCWVGVYSSNIISSLLLHSNKYVPSPGKKIQSLCTPPGYLFVFQTLHYPYPSISIYMYPLLGKSLFSRHYITSTTPFQSVCIPSWVNVYSPDITSPLPLHSKSICTPSWVTVILKTLYHLYPSILIYM